MSAADVTTIRRRAPLRRTILLWMATFLGYPAAGLVAGWLFGRVDGILPALIGGGLTGAVIAAAQWWLLRRFGVSGTGWIGAGAVGMAVGLALGSAVVGYSSSIGALAVQGAVCGLTFGIAQAPVLWRRAGTRALLWPVLLGLAWCAGWATTTAIGVDVQAGYTVFGSSGAIVATILTSLLPITLARLEQRART